MSLAARVDALAAAVRNKLNLKADLTDARFTDSRPARNHLDAPQTTSAGTYFRICRIDGVGGAQGAHWIGIVAGGSQFGGIERQSFVINFSQRGDNLYGCEIYILGNPANAMSFYVKQISTYVFELWVTRPAFSADIGIETLSTQATVTLIGTDNGTTDPGGLALLPVQRLDRTFLDSRYVQGTDARLSDTRAPTAGSVVFASLAAAAVAASGASSSTALVRADDSRLSNARTPTTHTHAASDVTTGTLADTVLPAKLVSSQYSANLNTATLPGNYYTDSSTTNLPSVGTWNVEVQASSSTVMQTARNVFGTAGQVGDAYRRTYTNSAWNPWVSLLDSVAVQDARYLLANDYAIDKQVGVRTVSVATTANITLSGLQTIDGVTLVAGQRVLVKDQTTSAQNGIYIAASGAWTRATDANTTAKIAGASVMVNAGAYNQGTRWFTNFSLANGLDVTAMTWARVSSYGPRNLMSLYDEVGGNIAAGTWTQAGGALVPEANGIGSDLFYSAGTISVNLSGWYHIECQTIWNPGPVRAITRVVNGTNPDVGIFVMTESEGSANSNPSNNGSRDVYITAGAVLRMFFYCNTASNSSRRFMSVRSLT